MVAQTVCGLLAYFDPTGGLPPSMWGMFLAGILGAIGAALAFLRSSIWAGCRWLWHQRLWAATTVLVAGAVFSALWYAPRRGMGQEGRKVIVLGLDGLDPRLLKQYRDEGRLPNFDRLAREGVFHELATTTPPQSPVAWSTFWTGKGPESHGVFDFVKRNPKNYGLDLALSDRISMRLPWVGSPFWADGEGPPLHIVALRGPLLYPPPRTEDGRLLAGMGVTDARGYVGDYFYYYSKRPIEGPDIGKDLHIIQLKSEGNVFKAELPGLLFVGGGDNQREPFELMVGNGEAIFRIQGKSFRLLPGQWSDWIRVEFSRGILNLQKAKVLTRALWEERDGQTTLYIAPLNFDPSAPLYPISYPNNYATELAEAIGPFTTRGMPFDTQALDDGAITDEAFLAQARLISGESEALLLYELGRFQSGLLFTYFEEPDQLQHMFWRAIDPEHPRFKLAETVKYRNVIPDCYKRCDELVGRIRAAAAGKEAVLVVLSDHGFGPFRTSVHLNAILRDLGYLKLNDGAKTSKPGYADVDWSNTRAYAVGLNAIYLNLEGREGKGIVKPDQASALKEEIARALEGFKDSATVEPPIHKIYVVPETAPAGTSPDLIVGYVRGYRGSSDTGYGKVPEATTEKNTRKWSGDHCFDPTEVPGIFLSSDPAVDAESLSGVGPKIVEYLRGR